MMNAMTKKKSAVLYHYPCPDGAFAALAAHLYFSFYSLPTLFFPNTVYDPITPSQLPLTEIDNIYLLDFVGPSGFVENIASKVDKVIILDHHKTALERFGGETCSIGENIVKVIDVGKSGATLAFDYFKERVGDEKLIREFQRVRKLFDYIEDGDLWKWRLPNSKAFSAGLKDLNIEFNLQLNPSLFEQLLALDLESITTQGITSLANKQRLISDALNQTYEIALGGGAFGRCLAVDADSISNLRSELGHQLATKSCNLELRGEYLKQASQVEIAGKVPENLWLNASPYCLNEKSLFRIFKMLC